jgi:hypothetical protein
MEINLIGSPVNGRNVFKEEDLAKPTQQGISPKKITQGFTLCDKLLLNAADENADRAHFTFPLFPIL